MVPLHLFFLLLLLKKFNNDFGNVMGLLVAGNGIGAFWGTYLMGLFYDLNGNYNLAFIFLMFIIVISMLLFMLAFTNKKI